mgnify:CR=1 FL=1
MVWVAEVLRAGVEIVTDMRLAQTFAFLANVIFGADVAIVALSKCHGLPNTGSIHAGVYAGAHIAVITDTFLVRDMRTSSRNFA